MKAEIGRRVFVGSVAAGMPLLAGGLLAQSDRGAARAAAPPDQTLERVLQQVSRECAHTYNEVKRGGPRREHARVAASNLRLLAALGLDGHMQEASRQFGERKGHFAARPGLAMMRDELRRMGADVTTRDLEALEGWLGQDQRAIDIASDPSFSWSAHAQRLASLIDQLEASLETPGAPGIRRVVSLDCRAIAYEIRILGYATGYLCSFGPIVAVGCLSSATSILLIAALSYGAGC